MLLARRSESRPLVRPSCGEEKRIIAFISDSASVERILDRIGEPGRLFSFATRDSEKPKLVVCPLACNDRF
jgi:hypothetical protein